MSISLPEACCCCYSLDAEKAGLTLICMGMFLDIDCACKLLCLLICPAWSRVHHNMCPTRSLHSSYLYAQDAVSDVGATLQKAVAFVSSKSKSVSASVDPEIEGPDGFIEQSSTSSGPDVRSEANDSGAAIDSQRTKQASGPKRQQENKIAG